MDNYLEVAIQEYPEMAELPHDVRFPTVSLAFTVQRRVSVAFGSAENRRCLRMFEDASGCSRMLVDASGCPIMPEGVWGCLRMPEDARE